MRKHLRLLAFAVMLFAVVPAETSASTPITGTATSCSSTTTCSFTITDARGTGWATTGSTISFQLPGEALATTGQPYTDSVVSQTCCYTWTMSGSFVATDANTKRVVVGTTNTVINEIIFCQRGCTYSYQLVSGSMSLTPTNQDPTSTTVTCSPNSIVTPASTTCTATVADVSNPSTVPTGKVTLSANSSSAGTWTNKGVCVLSSGHCSAKFTPADETSGTVTIDAAYPGDRSHYLSSASTTITVTSPPRGF